MCEGKDKYVWLATCMCEVTVYKFRYSTFTLWLIYVCVCDVMWWYTCCEAVLGRVWSVARKKSLPLSLSFCLSPIGWRVWKWNVILRVKHQTASSCWAVRSPTGQRMDHGPPVCLSVCQWLHTHAGMRAFCFCLCLLERSVILFCLFVTCSLWTFLNTVMVFHTHDAIQLCVCTHAQVCMYTICKPHLCVCHNDISLPSSHSICLLTDWG